MMKQFFYFLFSIVLIIGIYACAETESAPSTETTTTEVQEVEKVKVVNPIQETKPEAKPIKSVEEINADAQARAVATAQREKAAIAAKKKGTSTTKSTAEKKKSTTKKKSSSKKKATMKFDKDTHPFGIIKPGEVIDHKFYFTNTGERELVIKKADVTCGCTTPSYPFVPIAPGERGFIGVTYDSTGKLGKQKPTVTLTTNVGTKKIYMEGVVVGEMAKKKPKPIAVPESEEGSNN